MFSAALYQPIYLVMIAVLTFLVLRQYAKIDFMDTDRGRASNYRVAILLAIFLIIFIGFRPVHGGYFVDMANYTLFFEAIRAGTYIHGDNNFIWDPLFDLYGESHWPIEFFFALVSLIYFGGIFLACKKIFQEDVFLSFLVYLAAFSTYSFGTNGIKAGAAASLFLIAIAYRERKFMAILFLFLSLGFHHSMIVPVAAYLLAYFVKDRKLFLYGWIACFLIAALGITSFMSFLGSYASEGGARYLSLNNTNIVVSGFRPDFIFYSAIPIFLGEYLIRKFQIESEEYDFIWKVYVAANAVFLICTYASYINRIAYLSWLLYPILLIYPFLHCDLGDKQYQYLKYTVYGHLGFTLFMSFIYYGM